MSCQACSHKQAKKYRIRSMQKKVWLCGKCKKEFLRLRKVQKLIDMAALCRLTGEKSCGSCTHWGAVIEPIQPRSLRTGNCTWLAIRGIPEDGGTACAHWMGRHSRVKDETEAPEETVRWEQSHAMVAQVDGDGVIRVYDVFSRSGFVEPSLTFDADFSPDGKWEMDEGKLVPVKPKEKHG